MKIPTVRKAPAPLFDVIEYVNWEAEYQHSAIQHASQEYRLDWSQKSSSLHR